VAAPCRAGRLQLWSHPMSTKQEQPPKTKSVDTTTIDNWNSKFFMLDRRMARKIKFEEDKLAQKQPPQKQTPQKQPQQQVKSAEDRKKEILDRLNAIKEDLKRAEKAPQATPELKRDATLLASAKQSLMSALKAPDYDQAEKDIVQVENLSAKLASAESKKRTSELEKVYAGFVTNETPQTKKLATEVKNAITGANLTDITLTINGTFNQQKLDQIETDADAANSKLSAVTAAMKAVMDTQNKMGQGATISTLSNAIETLQAEAEKYLKDHKNVLTKEGKARVSAAQGMLADAKTVMAKITAANDQALLAAQALKNANGDGLSYTTIGMVENAEKSPHLLPATKRQCQFEIAEAKKRLAGAENARLLKIAKPLESMNANDLTGFMILSVEDALSTAEKNAPVDGNVKSQILAIIKNARAKLATQMQKQLADPGLTDKEKFAIQLSRGGAKPPKNKGESDSFFVYGSDGKPSYIFKPKEGENVKEGVEGGGAAREILTSKFNDLLKNATGLDFGVAPTKVAHLESDQFANGTRSQATTRVGALQGAIANEGDLLELSKDPTKLALIPDEDVQKIAIFDFVSLQMDRNCGNLLVQDQGGQKKLMPIDGGFSFPSADLYRNYSIGMASENKGGPNKGLKGAENAVSQLPQSDKPFTPKMLKVIADMKPDQLVAAMKQSVTDLEGEAPELKDTVDPKCFDNVGRSINFLQKAAKDLTPSQLTLVYAMDFSRVLDANDNDVDGLMDEIIATAKKKPAFDAEMANREKTYTTLGGDDTLKKAGWPVDTDVALKLDLKRKIEILQNPKANPPPPTQQQTGQAPPSEAQIYAQLGGDAAVKELAKRGEKIALTDDITIRINKLEPFKRYKAAGGDNLFNEFLQTGDRNVSSTSNMGDRARWLEKYAAYKAEGGDAELKKLSAIKDDRVAKWKNNDVDEKLRALKDYKMLARDGAEFDQLGGLGKIDELKKRFYIPRGPLIVMLESLRLNQKYETAGGNAKYFGIIRKFKADSTTLFENLDARGKKIRIALDKYSRVKGGIEGINEQTTMLDIMNACG
jgi:hypothetical protein